MSSVGCLKREEKEWEEKRKEREPQKTQHQSVWKEKKPRGGDSCIQTACHAREKITFSFFPAILFTTWVGGSNLQTESIITFSWLHDSWFPCKSSSFFLTWFRWWRLSFPSSSLFQSNSPLVPFIFQWMMKEQGSLKNHYSSLFCRVMNALRTAWFFHHVLLHQ